MGAMTFGGAETAQWKVIGGLEQPAVDALVDRALDAGINFFDTADVYSFGQSEIMLGKALGARRSEIVLATKVRGRMGQGPNQTGLSRLHITEAIEASLKRLNTDYIDLYQLHRFDPLTNLEDTLETLDDLVRAGKVRYIGCSNFAAWQIMKALGISRERALERFRCTQSYYSLLGRDIEREIVPLLKDQQLGLLVWSPLSGGYLSDKFAGTSVDASARRAKFDFPPIDRERAAVVLDALGAIAKARSASISRVALAWVLSRDTVTSVIIGAKKLEQLEDNLQSSDLALTAEEIRTLDEVSRIAPQYPAWMETLPPDRKPGEERRWS
jgi:aryl-alcohol dehydrogenase-like predicted oxidoreductase